MSHDSVTPTLSFSPPSSFLAAKPPRNPPSMPTREDSMILAAISAIQEATYRVVFPWALPGTWDSMLSPVDNIREGYRILGWGSIKHAFMLAFSDVCNPLEGGCPPGLFGTLENCLLCDRILLEILKKPEHPGVARIVTIEQTVGASVLIFIGGLYGETNNLNKILPWIKTLFIPLIRAGMTAYHEFRTIKKAKVSQRGTNCAGDLRILQRMRDLQFAKKPPRPTQLENLKKRNTSILRSPLSTPSSSPMSRTEEEHEEEDDVSIEESMGPVVAQYTNAAPIDTAGAAFASMDPFWDTSSPPAAGARAGAPGLSAGVGVGLALAVGAHAGVGMAAGVVVGVGVGVSDAVGSGVGADAPVLLEAFILKRKRPHSDENLPADDHLLASAINEPTASMQPRSPLTLRNIGNSSPISLFGPNSPPGWNLASSATPNGASSPKQQDEDSPSPDPPLALSLNQVLN
ncbi:hypothetical protein FB451DRAFT_1216767, partial [Mycena latifolia]